MLASEHVKIGFNRNMGDLIQTLGDAEFDLVLSLVDQLAEDLDELLQSHPAALSAVTRVSPYVFVCVRKSNTNWWLIVDIYEDVDPDGLPPGGGHQVIGRIGQTNPSAFPATPVDLANLLERAHELTELPLPSTTNELIVSADADFSIVLYLSKIQEKPLLVCICSSYKLAIMPARLEQGTLPSPRSAQQRVAPSTLSMKTPSPQNVMFSEVLGMTPNENKREPNYAEIEARSHRATWCKDHCFSDNRRTAPISRLYSGFIWQQDHNGF